MGLLEAAVFCYESAVLAKVAGADRLEVCEDYANGGFTSSAEYVMKTRELGDIGMFVMIRERVDNFVYTRADLEKMLKDIELFKSYKVDGFVYGGLDTNRNVNFEYAKEIIEAATPLPVTFHRAFDLCEDLLRASEEIAELGFKRILTSGGKQNAYEGRFVIQDLINRYGERIIFIPGGGIRKNNVSEIEKVTKAKEFHTAGITDKGTGSNMLISVEEIREIKNILGM
ncbi:MAG: copper homeostasis protein CutC [Ignavibacteriota bacterium]|nr:copper homeostasis protein CutC [Ignavibacteriota bacterium]